MRYNDALFRVWWLPSQDHDDLLASIWLEMHCNDDITLATKEPARLSNASSNETISSENRLKHSQKAFKIQTSRRARDLVIG